MRIFAGVPRGGASNTITVMPKSTLNKNTCLLLIGIAHLRVASHGAINSYIDRVVRNQS